MFESCPITLNQVDGNMHRIGAFFVITLVILYLISSLILFLYILALEFFIRLYLNKQFSIIFQLSKTVKKIFKIKTMMTDTGAKRLAAIFGLIFSILLIIEAHLALDTALYITASILLICALMEVIFDYCVGCTVYNIIKKIYPNFHS